MLGFCKTPVVYMEPHRLSLVTQKLVKPLDVVFGSPSHCTGSDIWARNAVPSHQWVIAKTYLIKQCLTGLNSRWHAYSHCSGWNSEVGYVCGTRQIGKQHRGQKIYIRRHQPEPQSAAVPYGVAFLAEIRSHHAISNETFWGSSFCISTCGSEQPTSTKLTLC